MKAEKKWIRVLAVFVAMFILPLTGKAVEDKRQEMLDYESDCRLRVMVAKESSDSEISDRTEQLLKLQDAGEIEIDLYRVAVLEKQGAYDKFAYRMLPDYAEALAGEGDVETVANSLLEDDTAEERFRIAQALAETVRARGVSADQSGRAEQYIDVPKNTEGESVGLYLLFIRQKDRSLQDCFVDLKREETGELATRIISGNYTYDFSPQLVTFPWMEPDTDGNPQYPWIYEIEVDLATKYASGYRYGNLEIVKRLDTYETGSPVTFVFEIEARDKDDAIYYSDVVTMSFTGTGEKSVRIEDRIRIDTDVTVREVYSGAAYELTGEEGTRTVRIAPDNAANDTAQVTFVNAYNDSGNNGGVVVNSFGPSADGSQWTWSRNSMLMTADEAED